jgi:hypothetical protein
VSDWKLSKHSGVDVTCLTCHGDQHNSDSDVRGLPLPEHKEWAADRTAIL